MVHNGVMANYSARLDALTNVLNAEKALSDQTIDQDAYDKINAEATEVLGTEFLDASATHLTNGLYSASDMGEVAQSRQEVVRLYDAICKEVYAAPVTSIVLQNVDLVVRQSAFRSTYTSKTNNWQGYDYFAQDASTLPVVRTTWDDGDITVHTFSGQGLTGSTLLRGDAASNGDLIVAIIKALLS